MNRRSERGSVALEFAIVAPSVLLIAGLIIFAGRWSLAQQSVNAAAAAAARAASIERSADKAKSSATVMAIATLANQGVSCGSMHVKVETSGFKVDVGLPASVSATVTCDLSLGDLTAPGFPGSMSLDASSTSPLDTYRERS